MCEKYLYGSERGAGHDRPYPYRAAPGWSGRPKRFTWRLGTVGLAVPDNPHHFLRIDILVDDDAEKGKHHFFPGHVAVINRPVGIRIEFVVGGIIVCALTTSFVPFG